MVASRIGSLLGMLGACTLVLLVAGCGCGDDSVPFISFEPPPASSQIGIDLAAVEVERPAGPTRVDVMFLLDDSFFNTDRDGLVPLGRIEGDGRIKTDVAQEIFDNAANTLLLKLVQDDLGDPEDFDLAFGVSRYEDYANFERSGPESGDPISVAGPVDGLARPFVLNLPILRRERADFQINFEAALEREAPGNGGRNPFDAQSAIEALWQLCTGEGFDGNLDGDKTDSGAPGKLSTMELQVPPLLPGLEGQESGDVPAIAAADFDGDLNGDGEQDLDEDGKPAYQLGDVPASGNIGGAGWRPDSIRFIVLYSNITTVTILEANDYPEDDLGRVGAPISCDANGPREEETVKNTQAFASTKGVDILDPDFLGLSTPRAQQAYARYGVEGGAIAVAPVNAATLYETIGKLNELNVEVLSIGFREASVGPGPNKPNQPGPAIGNNEPAVPDPQEPPLDNKAPFTWMSAVAILTGALDTETFTPILGREGERGLPLVYNLTTVNPSNGPITDDVVEDLSDRVGEWLPFVPGGPGGSNDPGFTSWVVTIDTTVASPDLTLFGLAPLVPDTDPDGNYVSNNGSSEQIIRVQNYFPGTPEPDPVRVAWLAIVNRTVQGTDDVDGTFGFDIDPQLQSNTGPPATTLPVPDPDTGLGAVFATISGSRSTDDIPDATSTLVEVLNGQVFFREILDQGDNSPAGVDIDSMAGPFPPQALPYPAP